jgi:hypothetical protein
MRPIAWLALMLAALAHIAMMIAARQFMAVERPRRALGRRVKPS